jgi:hypothetical protein
MTFSADQLHIGHVVRWDPDKVVIEFPFRRDYEFRLGDRGVEDQFYTVLFVRHQENGFHVWDPFTLERLAAPGPGAEEEPR